MLKKMSMLTTFASDELESDKNIMEAGKKHGCALEFAFKTLRGNVTVVMEAAEKVFFHGFSKK